MEPGGPDHSLRPALEALAAKDKDLARAYAACGLPPVRRHPTGFEGLIRIITAQQVSVASARAIMGRLEAAVSPLAPDGFLALDDGAARAVGLSRQKLVYGRALAQAVVDGGLDLDGLADLDDEAAIAALTQVKGIGRWTAEIYLLFSLQRPDVFPAGDLAVRASAGRLKGRKKTPDEKQVTRMAARWKPHRSAAARFLWHAYRHPGLPEG